jgi:Na+(H+)/acetate symporter ActP
MKRNMGTIDRIVRSLIAVAVVILYFTGQITGTAAVILGVLAVIFIATSVAGFCPLYHPFNLSSCKEGKC